MPVFPGFDISSAVVSNKMYIVDYNDASSAASPVTLVANTWTDLPNDGLGAFTNTQFLPPDVAGHLDNNGYLDVSDLPLGAALFIRSDFTVTPSANNASLVFRFSLGDGAGEYTLDGSDSRLDLGAGIPYRRSLSANFVYTGDSNTRDHPIKFQVKLSSGGTVVNAGFAMEVRR